jgi:hypothetical protein
MLVCCSATGTDETMSTRAAVALIIFRRPDLTRRVFQRIAEAKPPKLFIIADGPVLERTGEAEKCAAARAAVEDVDWDCDVVRDYSPTNMGPWRRIASGITAAFQQVEELVVLEDDCLPDPTFFRFCDELLERYRDDERVMHIAGNHFHPQSPRSIPYSYSFAWHNIAWGYATWRRAWQHFDLAVPTWPELKNTDFLDQVVEHPYAVRHYREVFDQLYGQPGEFDGYDWAWSFACWSQGGLSILPDTTLVQNVGFGPDSTHFQNASNDFRAALRAGPMSFPLRHPPYVVRDRAADAYIIDRVFVQGHEPPLAKRILQAGLPTPVYRAGARAVSLIRTARERSMRASERVRSVNLRPGGEL